MENRRRLHPLISTNKILKNAFYSVILYIQFSLTNYAINLIQNSQIPAHF
jgi:hypothetical protein